MSIQSEITRITGLKSRIRSQLITLGLAQSGATLSDCTNAIEGIENQGSITATVQEGDTFTIPAGYHNGSGTVSGVSGGGNYNLQSKTVTPTKKQQAITSDAGYYGLSDVTVNAIPDNYSDVSNVTAEAGDVLKNKVFVNASGVETVGTMINRGKVTATIDGLTSTSYTILEGYHNGSGTVSLTNDIENALAAI